MSLIGLIYIHGMLDNIIFYRGPWQWQLLWYNSMYEIYDSLGRKYLSAFYKETASRGADRCKLCLLGKNWKFCPV